MALTKAHLIERIRSKNGLTMKQGTDIVESTIDIIKDTLASGEDVLISGFGKFCVKQNAVVLANLHGSYLLNQGVLTSPSISTMVNTFFCFYLYNNGQDKG